MSHFNVPTAEMPYDEASTVFGNVQAKVTHHLASKGLTATSTPPLMRDQQTGRDVPYNGWLPGDLTTLDDNSLGWYLGMLSGWLDYVQNQLAEAYAGMTVANAKLEFVNAHLLMIHKKDGEKKRPEAERKAMVLTDRRYVDAQAEAIYYETYYRYVNAIFKAADQNYTAISRRITQRQQDIERQKRTSGLGNISGPMFRQP